MEATITNTKEKGLSGFALKYIAMVLMVLDHIEGFFEYTGKVPVIFSWLGRLAAPIFLFCIIEGFVHTHDRKKYFLHIYAIAIVMGAIQFSFYNIASRLVRPDGFFPPNQMLATFSILLVVLQGIEWLQKKQWVKGLAATILPLILPYLVFPLLMYAKNPIINFTLNALVFTVLPLHTAIADGGTPFIIMGVLLYLFRDHRKLQAASFVIFTILWDIVRIKLLFPELGFVDFFTVGYEWMSVFAVIFMLLYNGKRGHGSKHLFYWFYPAHIYILYALSFLLYGVLA